MVKKLKIIIIRCKEMMIICQRPNKEMITICQQLYREIKITYSSNDLLKIIKNIVIKLLLLHIKEESSSQKRTTTKFNTEVKEVIKIMRNKDKLIVAKLVLKTIKSIENLILLTCPMVAQALILQEGI